MTTLNSETIAKALKGGGLSSKQKILKAREAWNDNTFFFPNKDEFLLSWICACFAKPNTKKIDDCCIYQVDYWTLLLELLDHYQQRFLKDNRQTTPFIHVNLLASASLLLQEIYSPKSSIDVGQKIESLALIGKCLELLFSASFLSSYRPAFEHVSAITDETLNALEIQIKLSQGQTEEQSKTLEKLVFIAQLVLQKFDSQLVLAANQKKVFFTLVEKSLCKLLSVRYQLKNIEESGKFFNMSQQITKVICNGLFHPDIILEYTSVLKEASVENSSAGKQTTYVTKLFDTLEKMVDNLDEKDQMIYSVDITPVLLSAFLASFRQKRNTNTGATQDINTRVEFGMFIYLLKIVKATEIRNKSVYLETLSQLLNEVLQGNIYSARNDVISKEQFDILDKISKTMADYSKGEKDYDQGTILKILDIILQIDLSLVEPRLQLLWPIMLNPAEEAEISCLRFATSVLTAFTASRQIDGFVDDLIQHINKIKTDDVYNILKKPLFRGSFLKAFSESVSKHMPAPQALGIFQLFSQNLVVKGNETLNEQPKKKRKLTVKHNCRFALTSVYFCSFVSSLKLNTRQRQTFEEPSIALFNEFVKPSLNDWNMLNINTSVIPALQVHSALTLVMYENYTQKLCSEDLLWIENILVTIFQDIKDQDNISTNIGTVLCVNALLQHIYYHVFLLQNRPLKDAVDIVNLIMDFVSEHNGTESWYMNDFWSGSILNMDKKNQAKIACWKLLTDEWFETIVQCLENERSEVFISILYDTMKHENDTSSQCIKASDLSKRLLRSANFYEAKCSKEWSIQVFLNRVVDLFKTKFSVECSNPILNITAKMISSVNTKESPVTDKNALKTLVAEIQDKNANMEEDLEFDTNDINELAVLLRILLIFPNEYFEKNERTLLVYIASLMDIWCVANTQIDVLARSKISLTCKNLNLQFINFFSINSILGFDSSILAWLITSSHQLASESSEACKNTPVVLKKLSDELEKSVLRKILAFAGAKLSDKHATQYLKNATQQCVTSTKEYIAIGLPTESANLLNSLASFLSTRKISADTDLSSVIYATDTIIPVSNQVIGALKDTKQDVASILEQVKKDKQGIQTDLVLQYTSKFESAKRALYLTRLLHGYARTLGNSANKVIPMKELSGSLMELASPIIQLLQSTLDDSTKTIVCSLSTEYIAALCSMPMGDQHVKASKHILATFWFIYSLMHNIGDVVSIELLSNTFVSWIKNSSREQFDLVIIGFVEQAEEQAANRDSIEKEKHHLIFIQLLSLLFSASTEYQKAKLKRHIPVFIIKITLIAGKINSLKFLQMMLSLLDQLTVDESYRLSSFDLSLVLSCLIQVARPDVQKLKSQINRQFAHDLFTDICHILSNLMRHYKEQMTDVMPPFIGITQSLLHCFKSGHVHLVSGLNAKKHNVDSKNTPRTITLLSDFAPLNDTAAQQYSRLLKTITQKQHSYIAGKTNRSSQSVMKAISKHTPSVLVEYFTIQSNSTMSILQPSIKSALINALYEILDLCSDDDRSFIMTCLDAPGKLLFKEFYSNWKTNHKYSGQ